MERVLQQNHQMHLEPSLWISKLNSGQKSYVIYSKYQLMLSPPILDSDTNFGETDFDGLSPHAIPIHAAIGDSQGALFGHGCLKSGQVKTTYGTGSSIMMNSGDSVSSCFTWCSKFCCWRRAGKRTYVLEGNINYSAGIISYLKDDLKLIKSPSET